MSYNVTVTTINIEDIQRDLQSYLQQVRAIQFSRRPTSGSAGVPARMVLAGGDDRAPRQAPPQPQRELNGPASKQRPVKRS